MRGIELLAMEERSLHLVSSTNGISPPESTSFFHYQDEATIMVNMNAEDLQTKYDGNLNSEMSGPLHNLIAKVSKLVANN